VTKKISNAALQGAKSAVRMFFGLLGLGGWRIPVAVTWLILCQAVMGFGFFRAELTNMRPLELASSVALLGTAALHAVVATFAVVREMVVDPQHSEDFEPRASVGLAMIAGGLGFAIILLQIL